MVIQLYLVSYTLAATFIIKQALKSKNVIMHIVYVGVAA